MSDAMETLAAIVTLEGEIMQLRAINAELVRIVLDDTEGDLDFVKFRVRALFKCKLQPMSDHLIIRLRRAFDETGNSLLSDAIEELAHRSARNAELVAALEILAGNDLNETNCASVEVAAKRVRNIARAAIAEAKP